MKSINIFLNQKEVLNINNGLIQDSEGGIYNSSFFLKDDKKYVISRVEKNNELERHDRHTQHKPVIFSLSDDFVIQSHNDYKFIYDGDINEKLIQHGIERSGYQNYRIEDYRIFEWNNELWTNHNLNLAFTRPVISKINLEKNQLEHKKIKVFRLLNGIEKNWLFFEHNSKLKFIYSIYPFVIMSSEDGYEFHKEIYSKIEINKNIFWSGSTNPVLLDNNTFMFFVHYRDENKIYCHHLMLMDRETLQPILISENPVFREEDNGGIKSNVLYLMSHTRISNEDWIFSFGVGDYNTKLILIKHGDILKEISKND